MSLFLFVTPLVIEQLQIVDLKSINSSKWNQIDNDEFLIVSKHNKKFFFFQFKYFNEHKEKIDIKLCPTLWNPIWMIFFRFEKSLW